MNTDNDAPGARTLSRGLDVLICIAQAEEPLKFNDIQQQIGMPRASLHRMLAALQAKKFIRYDPPVKRYSVGSQILNLTRVSHDRSNVFKSSKPELSRVAKRLNVPVCLYVRDNDDVFVLDFEDPDSHETRVNRTWENLPLIDSAPGKAITSALRRPSRQVIDQLADVTLLKALGYAITTHQDTGSTLIASAVRNSEGHPEGAICCELPTMEEDGSYLHEVGRIIAEAAKRASSNTVLRQISPMISKTPPDTISSHVNVIDAGRDYMGENPIWISEEQKLYWLDILAPALRWYDPKTGNIGRVVLPKIIGGIAPNEQGSLLMLGHGGIYRWDHNTEALNLLVDPEPNNTEIRFNTVGISPSGDIWAGTQSLDNSPIDGQLYRIDNALNFDIESNSIGLPKNPAWSPDGKTMYITDGREGRILAIDMAPDNSLSNVRTFVEGNDDIGIPNGIAVDSEGGVWAAMVGKWCIQRFLADGTPDRRIVLPTPMPTGIAFGGVDSNEIFVTSTYLRLPQGMSNSAPLAGKLLSVKTEFTGA